MKKLLALVLALVMTLSLCVVSSNAKFDDAADIDYKEAVDVLSAVGVFVGDGSGKFYPDQLLTREQAAKLIAYLDLGNSVAEALPSIGTFTDVSAWANKYVDYLANAKIVNGIGGGKFGGTNQVTGYEFAKMLLVVLGWDADIEGMTGAAWQIGVAKLVKEYKLASGYKTNLSAPLTREAAAKLTFNAIQAKYVVKYNYNGGFTIVNNELSYNAKGVAEVSANAFYLNHWKGNDALIRTADSYNGLNRPFHKWTYQSKTVGTYTDTPVLTFVEQVKEADLYTQIQEAGYKFDTDTATDYTVSLRIYDNGADTDYVIASGTDLKNTINAASKSAYFNDPGVVVEVYANSDGYVNNIAKIAYTLEEVDSLVADKASTKLKDERAINFVGLNKTANADDATTGFEEVYAAVEAGDKVLVARKDNSAAGSDIVAVTLPTIVEGKISFSSTTKVIIDGTTYKTTDNVASGFNAKSTYKAYADANGFVYATTANGAAGNAYGLLKVYNSLNADGETVLMALLVNANGEELRVTLADTVTTGKKNDVYFLGVDTNGDYAVKDPTSGVVYKVDHDVAKNAKRVQVEGDYKFAFADDYKIIYLNNGKYTVSTAVQAITANTAYVVVNSDGEITTMFVEAAANTVIDDVDKLIFIAAETGEGKTTTASNLEYSFYTYAAYIDGKYEEGFTALQTGASGFYKVANDTDKNNYYVLAGNAFTGDDDYGVASETDFALANIINGTLVTIGNDDYTVTADTKVVCTVEDYDYINSLTVLKNEIKTTEITDVDVCALYNKDNGKLLYLYIYDLDVN